MARPSKLNKELIQNIGAEIEDGLPFIYVADLFGITRMSWTNWFKQGESDFEAEYESLEAEFFYTVRKSYAKFVKKQGKFIRSGQEGWAGAAWWLERTNRVEFGKDNDESGITEPVVVNPSIKPNHREIKNEA